MAADGLGVRAWPDAAPRAQAAATGELVVLGRVGPLPRHAPGPLAGLVRLRRCHVVGHHPRVVPLGVQARRVAPGARSAVHAQGRRLADRTWIRGALASARGRGARGSSARTTAPASRRRVGDGPRRVDLQHWTRARAPRPRTADAAPVRVEGRARRHPPLRPPRLLPAAVHVHLVRRRRRVPPKLCSAGSRSEQQLNQAIEHLATKYSRTNPKRKKRRSSQIK